MRFGLSWLQEYVRVDVPPSKLVELLDLSGTKVESVREPRRDISGVVVAEVLEILEHPNADNLTLVDVRAGDGVARVVCGARNFAVGDRVPFAAVGAHLGSVGLDITERKIRGQASQGMLCSAAELGISRDHSGILVLPPDVETGSDVVPLLGLDETVFELEITPNRPDCMSVVGIAREVAVLLGTDLEIPEPRVPSSDGEPAVQVEIEDAVGCPRYVARSVDGIAVAPAPLWMTTRLLSAGVRPVSNVVDATNYVMLELGQPLHAFDATRIHKRRIVVRRAKRNERLRTLDGTDRDLHPDDLVIADKRKVLALAGVMGGEDSEVSGDTTELILESAHFHAPSVAYTSRRHLLRTEASARFERGSDPELPSVAATRAAELIVQLAGGTAGPEVDRNPVPFERPSIRLRPQAANRLLGAPIPADQQAEYLAGLGMEVTPSDGALEVRVPGYRPDLKREVDLVEEVGRIAGFERLPSTLPPGRAGALEPSQRFERSLRRSAAVLGLTEVWTSSFMSLADVARLGVGAEAPAGSMVMLTNPLSEDQAGLRTTLLPGLLTALALNVAQGAHGAALFEIANVYEPPSDPLPQEALVLAAVMSGPRKRASWVGPEQRWDFFGAKGTLGALLETMGLPQPSYAPVTGPPFHPTRAAALSVGASTVGALGELHPDVCKRFEVPEQTIALEIALAPLLGAVPERTDVVEIPRFPPLHIDIAVIVPEDVPAGRVVSAVAEAGTPEVVDVRLFDVYRGQQVGEDRKSLALALEMRVPDRTLTDEEAAAVRERIVNALTDELGGELRH